VKNQFFVEIEALAVAILKRQRVTAGKHRERCGMSSRRVLRQSGALNETVVFQIFSFRLMTVMFDGDGRFSALSDAFGS